MTPGPYRERLPDTRPSVTHYFSISGHDGYITVGLYEDGRPAEVFIKVAKAGSTTRGLMDAVGILTSLSLQYGVPIDDLSWKFAGTRFDPRGHTNNADIPEATSIIDYIFQWMGRTFSREYRDETDANRRR